jgi:hypothetical protein
MHFTNDRSDTSEQRKAEGKKKLAAMIDALANRNEPPKIVVAPTRRLPLFPIAYDWKENKRVQSALEKMENERTPEMWEELVRGIGDERYCLTLKMMGDECFARNMSVGYFCACSAYEWLFGVCNQHLPLDPVRGGFPVRLSVGPKGDWKEWRKRRSKKQLYELQIEVCEESIREMEKVKGLTKEEKDEARKKIEEEIAKLRKTKRPIFTDYQIDICEPFSEKEAKAAREKLKDEK